MGCVAYFAYPPALPRALFMLVNENRHDDLVVSSTVDLSHGGRPFMDIHSFLSWSVFVALGLAVAVVALFVIDYSRTPKGQRGWRQGAEVIGAAAALLLGGQAFVGVITLPPGGRGAPGNVRHRDYRATARHNRAVSGVDTRLRKPAAGQILGNHDTGESRLAALL